MRKLYLVFVSLALLTVALAVPAGAQITETIEADIPFEFTIGSTTLPAGAYTLKQLDAPIEGVMEIRSANGRDRKLFLIASAESFGEPSKAELVFDRVGDRYFLSEIFEQGNQFGAEVPKSRSELKLEKEGAVTQIRSVTVVAQRAARFAR